MTNRTAEEMGALTKAITEGKSQEELKLAKERFLQRMRQQMLQRMPPPIVDDVLKKIEAQMFKSGLVPDFSELTKGGFLFEAPIETPKDPRFSIRPGMMIGGDMAFQMDPGIPGNEGFFAQVRDNAIRALRGGPVAAREETPEEKKQRLYSDAMRQLADTTRKLEECSEILDRVQRDPTIIYQIERMSKDRKYAFIQKMDQDIRIEACPELKIGDEVALNAKTMQIVEHLGQPLLEVSRFAPDKVPNVLWDDIGGLEEAKANMIEAIEMPHTHKELFAYYQKRPIKGILLSGPPGCGKTMLGKAAANSLSRIYNKESARTGFLYVKGPEILDQYVGQTEKCIRDIFSDARRHHQEHGYPAIIFLDEADSILAVRGKSSMGLGNTIVPAFLAEMDGMEASGAIVIIATNRPDVLDPAIVRDGRVDRKVTVKRPTEKSALAIVLMNMKGVPMGEGETVEALAKEMVDNIYSKKRMVREDVPLSSIVNGAMLANCVDVATSFAVKRDIANKVQTGLTMDDALMAIDLIQQQGHSVQHELEISFSIKEKGGDYGA